MRGYHHGKECVVERNGRSDKRVLHKHAKAHREKCSDRVLERIGLQRWRKASCNLPGVGEHEDFAAAQGRELARSLWTRRLNTNLCRKQRLERLISLGLMILDTRLSKNMRL